MLKMMAGRIAGLRQVAEAVWAEALLAADPEEAVHRFFCVRGDVLRVGDIDYFLSRFERIFVIGAGKAAGRMAVAVERILGHRITGGLIITRRGQSLRLRYLLLREAGHPLPDEAGVRATEEMLELTEPLSEKDLVIALFSGGASAMLSAPLEGISVPDLQRATRLFLSSGLTIHEINTIRKHLCRVKGGRLAEHIYPATIISLLLSDVVGDQPEVIASGPTAPDPTTYHDALMILKSHEILEDMPASIQEVLARGERGELPETPKGDSEVFKKAHHQIVGGNRISLEAGQKKAHRLGMNSMILSSFVSGESREIANFYVALAREIRQYERPVKPPACLIAGGETTVTLRGQGSGGRCQELALAVAQGIAEIPGVVFLAAGTDGQDGNSEAAGAVADSTTLARAKGLSAHDYLKRNDSHSFFKQLGDLIITGPTGTNVMDIHLLLVG